MNYWSLSPPAQWRAGFAGAERTPFYFDCADCGAVDPPIAGILSSDGTYAGIAILGQATGSITERRLRPAMFCAACFERRLSPEPKEQITT